MQGVVAQNVLGALIQLALTDGQQLRADRRVNDVLADVRYLPVKGMRADVPHQTFHQCLGHGAVYVVHAHVVAIVGAEAQRRFAQVAGAQHDAAHFVGIVHEDLRALPGLTVFVGHVVDVLVLPDVGKMLLHRRADGDLTGTDAQTLHQNVRVGLGARAGAHAGHGNGVNAAAVKPQLVIGPRGHQQRQRAV